jgi:hypothetical protein
MTRTTIAGGRIAAAPDLPEGLPAPARRALAGAGFERLDQLARAHASEVARLHGMGPRGIEMLRRALAERGKSFADESPVISA